MYAGIGAPCSDEIDLVPEVELQDILHLLLYTHGIGLALPSVVVCTVVGEVEEVSHG